MLSNDIAPRRRALIVPRVQAPRQNSRPEFYEAAGKRCRNGGSHSYGAVLLVFQDSLSILNEPLIAATMTGIVTVLAKYGFGSLELILHAPAATGLLARAVWTGRKRWFWAGGGRLCLRIRRDNQANPASGRLLLIRTYTIRT